jgi:carbon storage regulator
MLVLTRKPGEKIYIGPDITILVVKVKRDKIRIGIDAPKEVAVLRAELTEQPSPECYSTIMRRKS